jgi:LacI family transcriptional regulator, galactose operon repressor
LKPHARPTPRLRPTLKDVAAIASVDPSLVSRVVNGDERVRMTPETRARILDAIEQVGYRKNLNARGLRTGSTGLIACVVPDLATPSYTLTIEGAQERAREAGYELLIVTASQHEGDVAEFRRLLDEQRVDGLLVGSGVLGDRETALQTRGAAPIVVFNRLVERAEYGVVVDDEQASRVAAWYLARHGHKRCAMLVAPNALETTKRRYRGFSAGLKERGCQAPRVVNAQGWSPMAGREASKELFSLRPQPSAVYSASGLLHFGLLSAASAQGITVPDDLSVIALNDSELNEFTSPPVTAVRLPLEQQGAAAVDLLIQRIEGKAKPAVKVIRKPAPKVIERDSVRSID